MRADKDPGAVAQAVVQRARQALGAPFRPQGRSLETGLDCIGLAVFALGLPAQAAPSDYWLRGGSVAAMRAQLAKIGLNAVAEDDDGRAGDLAAFQPGPGQIHLAVLTGQTLIHADAALRLVVERPLPAPWPALGLWRRDAAGRRN